MTTDIIARYVTGRIEENAKWYTIKQAIDSDFSNNLAHTECYHLLQLALLNELNDGHTVLAIDDMPDADAPLPAIALSAWQQHCIAPVVRFLSGDDHQALFIDHIAHLSLMTNDAYDHDAIKQFISEALKKHQKKWRSQELSHRQTDAKIKLALSLYRLCYLFFTKIDSLDKFIDLLAESAFFGDATILAKHRTMHQPPICYLRRGASLYLWTSRAYHAEANLLAHIWRIKSAPVAKFALHASSASMNPEQKTAVNLVSNQAFTMITGGPGTGKTYTVAQIVIALSQLPDADGLRLGLAAPTGKAAQRMSESLIASLPDSLSIAMPEPKTIHRLLGIGSSGTPRHHDKNPLALDVLIIDEASMLGTELACQLFAAIPTGCRVILLGDAHQLAAVDAGAVLADLCHIEGLQGLRVDLIESRRFGSDSGIGKLAKLINTPIGSIEFSQILTLIDSDQMLDFVEINHHSIADIYEKLVSAYQEYFVATKNLRFEFAHYSHETAQKAVDELFDKLNQYRILCAQHKGVFGDEAINAYVSERHQRFQKIPSSHSPWYHGRVVMVTKNLYDLALFNGDVGICLWAASGLVVYFEGKSAAIAVDVLSDVVVSTAYAITVHKSQGSEWQEVAMVFDDHSTRLLSKELIYTAVTRAKSVVRLYGSQSALIQAVNTPTMRRTGLTLIADGLA